MAAAQLFLCRKRALAAHCLGLLFGEDEERPQKRLFCCFVLKGHKRCLKEYDSYRGHYFFIGQISDFLRVSGLPQQLLALLLRPPGFIKFAAKPQFADSQSKALNSILLGGKSKLQW